MGWCDANREGHEGYLIGLVEDEDRGLPAEAYMRRLAYPRDDAERSVEALQVACDCGWRSARFSAPPGTTWLPFSVQLPAYARDAIESISVELWRCHLSDDDPFRAWVERCNR